MTFAKESNIKDFVHQSFKMDASGFLTQILVCIREKFTLSKDVFDFCPFWTLKSRKAQLSLFLNQWGLIVPISLWTQSYWYRLFMRSRYAANEFLHEWHNIEKSCLLEKDSLSGRSDDQKNKVCNFPCPDNRSMSR